MNTIELYNTRTMLAAIERIMPNHLFLRDTFFSNRQSEVTEHIDVDYRKGKRKMAPFVAPLAGGKVMDRQGYETTTLGFPKIAPARLLTALDIATRMPGEAIYGGMTPEERAQQLIAKDTIELLDYIDRREEWMISQILFGGKIDIDIEGARWQVDYKFENYRELTGAEKWDTATGRPLADLKNARMAVIQKTGTAPDFCIMASDVADAYADNEQVKEVHDKLNYFVGDYRPEVQNDAVTFIERITSLALDVLTYDDWYIDDDDNATEKPFVPAGHVLLAKRSAPNTIHYGPVTQMENGAFRSYATDRVPRVYDDEQNNARMFGMTSRPMPVPYDIDSWYVLKVI